MARSPRLSRIVEGAPVVLARAGEPEPGQLARHAVSKDDRREALRQSGPDSADEARRVTLEPSGTMTVLKDG